MKIHLERLKQNLIAQSKKADIVSNNLANINTNGYKKDKLFYEIIEEKRTTNLEMNVVTEFKQGILKETKNPLDIALSGSGYFLIDVKNTEGFTRDGHFTLGTDGYLQTASGYKLMGDGGWINLAVDGYRSGRINVNDIGEVYLDDVFVDQLKIVDFKDHKALEKIGDNAFGAPKSNYFISKAKVIQGSLEESNVNPVGEMVGLMEIHRFFESTQKAVKTLDDVYRRAANDVGRFQA